MRLAGRSVLNELEKLGTVSTEQARRALDQLDSLEQSKPDAAQVGRYATTGALAGAGFGALGHIIQKKPVGGGAGWRGVAADAVKGALGAGALPLVQTHLDRRAQIGTLKQFVQQPATGE